MINTGGSAFPCIFYSRDSMGDMTIMESEPGMTLRDWFAEGAMKGMINCPEGDYGFSDSVINQIVFSAYKIADAMIREREEK